MIVVDDRVGAVELARKLPGAVVRRLEYADFWFPGRGPAGSSVSIGIERKTVDDLVNSIVSGRLSTHQLPGMLQHYDYCYLLVEGYWRPSPATGLLEVMRRGWVPYNTGGRTYRAALVSNYLNSLSLVLGVHVYKTLSDNESCHWLKSLYAWWNNKKWDEHRAHLAIRKPEVEGFLPPSLIEMVCACLPGVGPKRARSVASRFSNVRELCAAVPDDFMAIDGIGKKTANGIVEALG